MISFEELEYYYNNNKEKFDEWVNKSTFELDYYTKEGQLLILINTYKIENYIVNLLNEHFKDSNIKFSHYDEFFRYYYPELKHSNGPDIKVITDKERYFIEVKTFISDRSFKKTISFYSVAYKYGIEFAKKTYGEHMNVCDYRYKYDTRYMVFVLHKQNNIVCVFMNTSTGDIVAIKNDTLDGLYEIPKNAKKPSAKLSKQ